MRLVARLAWANPVSWSHHATAKSHAHTEPASPSISGDDIRRRHEVRTSRNLSLSSHLCPLWSLSPFYSPFVVSFHLSTSVSLSSVWLFIWLSLPLSPICVSISTVVGYHLMLDGPHALLCVLSKVRCLCIYFHGSWFPPDVRRSTRVALRVV